MRTAALRSIAVLFFLTTLVALLPFSARAQVESHQVVIERAASDGSSLDALNPANAGRKDQTALHIPVTDASVQAQIKTLNLVKGDLLDIALSTASADHGTLKSLSIPTGSAPLRRTILVLILCAALYLVACVALTRGNPLKLIIGEDGHYSNSKLQMFLWFGILISAYLACVYSKWVANYGTTWGNITIPNNLLLLSGMSALTFAAAKGITTSKVQAALDAGIVDPKRATKNPRFLYDLMHNDKNQLDFGDFQMIVVTLVAVGMYVVLILHHLGAMELRAATSLPDVDTTILASFGLGQGAYLTKKAVGNAGDT